ncbi:TrbC/VirB2 family protein, partial [Chlamydiales bacterium]|nr:TrbC/VirB2 family protein [Chlamydiales bacterium]
LKRELDMQILTKNVRSIFRNNKKILAVSFTLLALFVSPVLAFADGAKFDWESSKAAIEKPMVDITNFATDKVLVAIALIGLVASGGVALFYRKPTVVGSYVATVLLVWISKTFIDSFIGRL